MSFDKGLCEQKLMVNLSDLAQQVVDEERLTFGAKTTAEYLNIVFREFHSKSNASISITLSLYQDKLEDNLRNIKLPTNKKTEVINCLLKEYKDKLTKINNSYPRGKGNGIRFFIQKDNYDFLYNDVLDSDGFRCSEEKNYTSIRNYYKAVIEEYCRKPFVERERIYRSKIYNLLQNAITNKCIVEITLINNKKFYVKGYKIDTDSKSLYNYFVGICTQETSQSTSNYVTFRISNITQVRIFNSKKYAFSRTEKDMIEKQIQALGIQFLGDSLEEISVRLTENGIRKYNTMLHLRPEIKKIINSNIYIFNCTLSQAKFYFFKFGEDALVLKPEYLSQEFKEMYIKALSPYNERWSS